MADLDKEISGAPRGGRSSRQWCFRKGEQTKHPGDLG